MPYVVKLFETVVCVFIQMTMTHAPKGSILKIHVITPTVLSNRKIIHDHSCYIRDAFEHYSMHC